MGGWLGEDAVEATGGDEPRIEVVLEEPGVLEGLDAHLGAEGAGFGDTERGEFCGEHHDEAEHLGLVGLEGAVVERAVVRLRRARDGDAVVEVLVERARLHVHGPVDVDGTREAVEELDLAVAVRGVEVGHDFVKNALGVLLGVVEVHFQRMHSCLGIDYYMFTEQSLRMLVCVFLHHLL